MTRNPIMLEDGQFHELTDLLPAPVVGCDLPATMRDGRPATWLRITSHRAADKVNGLVDHEEFYNFRSGHVSLVPTGDVERMAAELPAYCRGSVRIVKRPKVQLGWRRCWA